MLTTDDKLILKRKGISEKQIEDQLKAFETGFPFLEIKSIAELSKGIIKVQEDEIPSILKDWGNYLNSEATIIKFVPASGAASRMFKDLFEFLEGENNEPTTSFEKKFFNEIEKFAFYEDLSEVCYRKSGKNIKQLIEDKAYKPVVENLLSEKGLNYGSLPKGLLRFHSYPTENRTPMQEHFVEGALYSASTSGNVNLHFTVSKEHRSLFEKHLAEIISTYEKNVGVTYNISFSEQKSSTDTIAADQSNQPFRDKGELVFRPGGHGALIENLNDLNGDIIFIKNIDNVVPDSLKELTVTYKKVIAGMLVNLQKQCFAYLKELENKSISVAKLSIIKQFCEVRLNNHRDGIEALSHDELREYLFNKLNRPIRVCGMVKNVGEPGGGPFLTVNSDGTVSPQILESSQIDLNNPVDKEKMMKSTHFNPVDLVCGVKNYRGEKFDLLKFVDKKTGFISLKSKNGKELKALELPGLWNGAMSDWNTIFVEVPIETFNPVKTVNDLLRPQHQ
jgi:hypothetical protein